MKKLNILKAVVDLFWVLSWPLIPLMVMFMGYVLFINTTSSGIPIRIHGLEIETFDIAAKTTLFCSSLGYIILMYCIYLFRKILRYFQQLKIFDDFVFKALSRIGVLIVVSAFLIGIPVFIYRLYHGKLQFELGFNPFFIMLILGLFFMILGEIFKIAKSATEENELTI